MRRLCYFCNKVRLLNRPQAEIDNDRKKLFAEFGKPHIQRILANGMSSLMQESCLVEKSSKKITKRTTKRAMNDQSLKEYIANALKDAGHSMKVGEIVNKVKRKGYVSNSDSFHDIVNQTLIKERKLFRQVSRGVYELVKK